MGTLYLVATPIGNLLDITLRALQILKEVNLIAAEDTRQTMKILQHYEIHTPLTSYYEHNKIGKLDVILAALSAGDVAVVSDAGTPALNDPGYELVKAALEAGHHVSPIPGASAPVTALVVSGLPTDRFAYLGYLPRKSSERRRVLQEYSSLPYTLLFLEAPHRLNESLRDLQEVLGDRCVAVARELTKLHEEVFRGTISNARAYFKVQAPRGEFTLVVAGSAPEAQAVWSEEQMITALREELSSGIPPAKIAAGLAARSGWSRRTIYNMLTQIQSG